jgi:hypothetical protein
VCSACNLIEKWILVPILGVKKRRQRRFTGIFRHPVSPLPSAFIFTILRRNRPDAPATNILHQKLKLSSRTIHLYYTKNFYPPAACFLNRERSCFPITIGIKIKYYKNKVIFTILPQTGFH